MTIRQMVMVAVLPVAGLAVVMSGGAPTLTLAATAGLAAWALVNFLRWREALRLRLTDVPIRTGARSPQA
jgi:hypothetical protein